jgi:hypothetical protein
VCVRTHSAPPGPFFPELRWGCLENSPVEPRADGAGTMNEGKTGRCRATSAWSRHPNSPDRFSFFFEIAPSFSTLSDQSPNLSNPYYQERTPPGFICSAWSIGRSRARRRQKPMLPKPPPLTQSPSPLPIWPPWRSNSCSPPRWASTRPAWACCGPLRPRRPRRTAPAPARPRPSSPMLPACLTCTPRPSAPPRPPPSPRSPSSWLTLWR